MGIVIQSFEHISKDWDEPLLQIVNVPNEQVLCMRDLRTTRKLCGIFQCASWEYFLVTEHFSDNGSCLVIRTCLLCQQQSAWSSYSIFLSGVKYSDCVFLLTLWHSLQRLHLVHYVNWFLIYAAPYKKSTYIALESDFWITSWSCILHGVRSGQIFSKSTRIWVKVLTPIWRDIHSKRQGYTDPALSTQHHQ